MLSFILWYLTVSLVGLLSFPLAFRLLPALPDRGYVLNRTLGILIWGYSFWLLASLGIIRNNLGGLVLTLGVLLAISLWAVRGIHREDFLRWWHNRRRLVFSVEILFFVCFAAWAIVRAANPDIYGTEKPMELAFINAILRSPTFPPHDPWLSGYAISYYYFGYVLVAMLAKFTATPGGVAFNLGVSLVFSLSAIGAYGLVYDLLIRRFSSKTSTSSSEHLKGSMEGENLFSALLGPFFILIVSNLEGFLEVLHARGIFSSTSTSGFWRWLDIPNINQTPTPPFSWLPRLFGTGSWWWWQASRVVQDYDLRGVSKGDVIDEFPFFSYLLADLHPHVLAMPFAFLAIALALNVVLGGGSGGFDWFRMHFRINPQTFGLAALALGGMAFLNTWDFPIYVALFCGAYVIWESQISGWSQGRLWDFLKLGFALGLSGVILYFPFYIGFSSQAGGVLPNLIYPTRGAQMWVMFSPLLVPICLFLYFKWKHKGDWIQLRKGLFISLGLALVLFVLCLLLGWGIINLPVVGDIYLGSLGAQGNVGLLFKETLLRRVISPGGWITTIILLGASIGLLWPRKSMEKNDAMQFEEIDLSTGEKSERVNPSILFGLLLILLGTLLVFGPEFFYLRDQFGYRINTIFKFYFQAWLLWGIAGAFVTLVLLRELKGVWGVFYRLSILVVLLMSLTYPVLSLWDKTHGFDPPQGWTLDGSAFMSSQSPDDMAAIQWLQTASQGVVVEAVGESYSEYARVSTFSGQPTVLGWPGHESQWRGGAEAMGTRRADIEEIYRSNDINRVQELLRRYNVRYVFFGSLERSRYGNEDDKFNRFLTPVFQTGQTTIYEVPEPLS
jgi:YYY domain-containing protein